MQLKAFTNLIAHQDDFYISLLKWESITKPQLNKKGDDVIVRIIASSINHLDIWVRSGITGMTVDLPIILGSDGAGTIVELDRNITQYNIGEGLQKADFQEVSDITPAGGLSSKTVYHNLPLILTKLIFTQKLFLTTCFSKP